MLRAAIQASASWSATHAPVIAAVRVPPSAWSTSQSTTICFSPSAARSGTARSERPIRRWISCVRPDCLPAAASRRVRSVVARGSMPYSAVTQPRAWPLSQGGTGSPAVAVQSTWVSPNRTRQDPSAWRETPRSKLIGRSASAARLDGRTMAKLLLKRGTLEEPPARSKPFPQEIDRMPCARKGERLPPLTMAETETRAGSAELFAAGLGAPRKEEVSLATPMIAQYLEIKAANADCLLFYRMGDFYELFFEDAEIASRALGIALTKRGKHLGADIPMCGVPVHAADDYLQRLIAAGHRVAVCEQTEDPAEAKRRGPKAVVRRDVVRLVTPGTLTEETLLDARAHNFLTALFRAPAKDGAEPAYALASLDISTGELIASEVVASDLPGELARIKPGEVLIGDDLAGDAALRRQIEEAGAALTPCPRAHFDSVAGERALNKRLGVGALDAFGEFTRAELAALAGLLTYVEITQVGKAPLLRPPRKERAGAFLVIDAATRANLELVRSNQGGRAGSLLAAIDRTVTAAGARELASRLASPLTDPKGLNARLDAVAYLTDEPRLRHDLRAALRLAPDLARALARLALSRGGPRDLGAVRDAIASAEALAATLAQGAGALGLPLELSGIRAWLSAAPLALAETLSAALADTLPLNARDGGFIRDGADADLDENRRLRDGSRQVIAGLQATYAEKTGIKSLKVRHNNVLGYFVEVTALHVAALTKPPHAELFIHRQTLANAVRFSTPELAALEARITQAADRALALELEIFARLSESVLAEQASLSAASSALAELDHYAALAELAVEENYVRPRVDASLVFAVEEGRHPMVEQNLRRNDGIAFVGNDCFLASENKDTRIL